MHMAKNKKPRATTNDQVKQFIKNNDLQTIQDIQDIFKNMWMLVKPPEFVVAVTALNLLEAINVL